MRVASPPGAPDVNVTPNPLIVETVRDSKTLITADAGYHSDANLKALQEQGIPAMIADNRMRRRDERIDNAHHKAKDDPLYDKTAVKTLKFFRPEDFRFVDDISATCPAGKTLRGNGSCNRTPQSRGTSASSPSAQMSMTRASACAARSTRRKAEGCTASASRRSSQCLRTSATTRA